MNPIRSARLAISTWSDEDVEVAQRLWGDPKVMEFIDVRGGLNHVQAKEKLQQEIDRQNEFGVQYWKVIFKDTGEAIGCCGLRPYDLPSRFYEIGFHIMSQYWGQGYATEAAKAVIDYAFNSMKVAKLFAGHNPKNSIAENVTEIGI